MNSHPQEGLALQLPKPIPTARGWKYQITSQKYTYIFFFGNGSCKIADVPYELNFTSSDRLHRIRQTHSDRCFQASETTLSRVEWERLPEGDALSSHSPNQALMISTADCIPLLVADLRSERICAIHAGWRGIANGITLKALSHAGLVGKDCIAFLGPHIRKSSFEIGLDVRDQLVSALATQTKESPSQLIKELCSDHQPGKCLFDTTLAIRKQLLVGGLKNETIMDLNVDTFVDKSLHSFRRDQTKQRLCSVILMSPN